MGARTEWVKIMKVTRSAGNVFSDVGFAEAEAEELAVKSTLIAYLTKTIQSRKLTQQEAASLCGIDQPTLSKALNGRLQSLTLDRLARWLVALGKNVRITVDGSVRTRRRASRGTLSVHPQQN